MAHLVDDLRLEAEVATGRMRETAREARRVHARSELMRHMLTAARTNAEKPRAEAVEAVVGEWLDAWNLPRDGLSAVAREMRSFTEAVHDYAAGPDDGHDARLRASFATLDEALAREGSSLADEMAFRSQCAHGWWEQVEPVPADLPGRRPRPAVPKPDAGRPFWEAGCAAFCR